MDYCVFLCLFLSQVSVVDSSLFPLIGVYFKQLGLNPAETGMLMGFRPFIELIAVPFWGNVAERWRRWKTVLLFSLFCWVAFTLSLAFIQPDPTACLVGNESYVVLAEVMLLFFLLLLAVSARDTSAPLKSITQSNRSAL